MMSSWFQVCKNRKRLGIFLSILPLLLTFLLLFMIKQQNISLQNVFDGNFDAIGLYGLFALFLFFSLLLFPFGVYLRYTYDTCNIGEEGDDIVLSSIQYGWHGFKKNMMFRIALVVVVFGISGLYDAWLGDKFSFIQEEGFVWTNDVILSFGILKLVSILLGLFLGIAILVSALRVVYGKSMSRKKSFSRLTLLGRITFATLLYILIVLLGFLLFIIPGLYLAIRLQFFNYALVDNDIGSRESLKLSWRITRGYFWRIVVFNSVMFFLQILGLIVFFIGILVTAPVMYISQAKLYFVLYTIYKKSVLEAE